VSTSDAEEAARISAKAKAAGFATVTVKDKGLFKVRLSKAASRADIDAAEGKLKAKGFKTFAVKVG
jgi:cell division protein FtsN